MLRRVSYAERELVVIGPGEKGPETETVVGVPADARVFKDGKAIPFDELTDGVEAAVQVDRRGGKLLARQVQVGDAPPPEAAETRLSRARRLLKLADRILEMVEGMRGNEP